MKKIIFIIFAIAVLAANNLWAHIDNYLLPEECGSCHVGHGLKGEPMLSHTEEEACYQCHGSENKRTQMKSSGKLSQQAELANIELEFNKMYRHPVKTGVGHSSSEKLPGLTSSSINHSECVDCHNPHQRVTTGEKRYDVGGRSLSGQYVNESIQEYEVCLKCHGTNIGIKSTSKNLSQSFALSSKSQHPVTTLISANRSVSLKIAQDFSHSMKCTDCHNNDNKSGPRGPHGSRYEHLLNGNYDTDVYNIESLYAYEFCYDCHNRTSILSNESFPKHREHIVGNPAKNIKGTSCFTCHASHSSEDNMYLIDFNPEAVSIDDVTHQLQYNSTGKNHGSCNLKCHDHSHSPANY